MWPLQQIGCSSASVMVADLMVAFLADGSSFLADKLWVGDSVPCDVPFACKSTADTAEAPH